MTGGDEFAELALAEIRAACDVAIWPPGRSGGPGLLRPGDLTPIRLQFGMPGVAYACGYARAALTGNLPENEIPYLDAAARTDLRARIHTLLTAPRPHPPGHLVAVWDAIDDDYGPPGTAFLLAVIERHMDAAI